jgi:alpha,alpha-trehalose-phosphate synthase [UDP-forming]
MSQGLSPLRAPGVPFEPMGLLKWLNKTPVSPLIVLSNREPFVHHRSGRGAMTVTAPAGGLISALQPLMVATGGTWIAWGSGSADFEVTDAGDTVRVPPESPAYRLRRLRLTEAEVAGYYLETANRSLWPLCHSQLPRFVYAAADWLVYRRVNERFAAAAIAESRGQDATCWVQDYHLALVPGILRRVRHLFVHQFWHIPWPSPDILRLLPSARALLTGLLGNHLIGFQTAGDARNFLACVRRFVRGAVVNPARGVIRLRGQRTVVRDFPISVDTAAFTDIAGSHATVDHARQIRRTALPNGGQLLLGVDRVDYTKGIPHRFRALGRMLDDHPELAGKVTLLQIGVPSRAEVPEYAEHADEVMTVADEVNARHARGDWSPIRMVGEHLDQATVVAYYRAADVCIVSPLQDGMNLVAKEFVACQRGQLGVLVLSRFAGAAREMREALLVNPYDNGAVAEMLYRALTMAPEERERRMALLRRRVERHTIHDWMGDIFREVARLQSDA